MARVTAAQASTKWRDRLVASGTQIKDGVMAVQTAPGVKAAAVKNLWLQRVTASADKWAARVGAVPLGDWQTAMIEKGIPRISQGAAAAQPKVEAFMTDFLPFLDAGKAKVNAIPKGDLNASIARMTAMITHTSTYKRPAR